jgi:hypothetical protein
MANETLGICGVFLLLFVLLLLRQGLVLIGRRGQKLYGVYLVRLNRDDRQPDSDTESDSADAFPHRVEAGSASLAAPGAYRHSFQRSTARRRNDARLNKEE